MGNDARRDLTPLTEQVAFLIRGEFRDGGEEADDQLDARWPQIRLPDALLQHIDCERILQLREIRRREQWQAGIDALDESIRARRLGIGIRRGRDRRCGSQL